MAELSKEVRRVGGELEPRRGFATRRGLLPQEIELCDFVGLSEDEYFHFLDLTQSYNGKRAPEYDHIPDIVNGNVIARYAVQLVISIVVGYISSQLNKPKQRKAPPSLQTDDINSQRRYAPQQGFDSLQSLAALGENIPLDTERGYHVHFKDMDHLISRPVIFLDRGFGITPMQQGLRAVGTVELGGLENPISKKRIDYIDKCAKELLPQLGNFNDEWLGFRPTLPDFLPVIGPSLKNRNIIYAFGHHHLGWTLGAITGKIVSGIVNEEKTNLDLSPYSSSRFN